MGCLCQNARDAIACPFADNFFPIQPVKSSRAPPHPGALKFIIRNPSCLVGYGKATRADHADIDCFAAAINTALFVFLGVVSVRLVRLRKGALRLAGWLLALETIGAVLLLSGADYPTTRRVVEPPSVFAILCVALVM